MRALSWEQHQRLRDIGRGLGGHVGRAVVGVLTKLLGAPRLAAWAVESTRDRRAAVAYVTEELTPLAPVTASDVVAQYVRGFVLMGRGGDAQPEPVFRYVSPRAIIDVDTAHVPKRVRTYQRRGEYVVDMDAPLSPVIAGCADRSRTWIVAPVVEAWSRVEDAGYVRNLAAYRDGELVAGIWGIEVGRTFGIVSMFHHESGAGAVVMATLVDALGDEWDVIDCGSLTANFARYGAHEMGTDEFSALVLAGVRGGRPGSAERDAR
ncbi:MULTISPECIES: hypothetical protein [Oerskovia]|uniref:Leucyl/phenylalanyl-tRNA--protein transferase n=1 Tax=Oerskovia merdavium TaxID=2762227 RepID=A0ABR8TVD9_9CELL|nr:hypothetical protein [Oerskovia merdavium]MBD7979423.1 hypothetical protein [Oerskovia merdavium]